MADGTTDDQGGRPLVDSRPPTAALPKHHSRGRAVAEVPPTLPPRAAPLAQSGVAARLVPEDAGRRRLTSDEYLRGGVALARLVALAAGVLIDRPTLDVRFVVLLAVAAALLVTRGLVRTGPRWQVIGDTVATAAILAWSEGIDGPFSLFADASAVGLGVTGGMGLGLAGAAVLAGVAVVAGPGVAVAGDQVGGLVAGIALFPVGAALGALLANVLQSGQAALLTTNRILADLERLTAVAPQTLSPAKVAAEAAAEFRRALGADLAIVLFEREGTLLELGRAGARDVGPHLVLDGGWEDLVALRGPRVVDVGSFPVALTRHLPLEPMWVVVPLRARDSRVGLVLVGGDGIDESRAMRTRLAALAAETALALDNTQLFARIEDAATAAERQRLASDLHDGVAQQLAHVRFELELLARRADDETRQELSRLARVAHRATDDVRAAIRGLQATAMAQGLVPALRSLVTDLDGASGPSLHLDVRGAAEVDEDTGAELYRIAQEALSNALRHANASEVVVEMDLVGDLLVLAVEDDGDGLSSADTTGQGLGLRTMKARAERIGATCSVRPGETGGTRVEVRLPLGEVTT